MNALRELMDAAFGDLSECDLLGCACLTLAATAYDPIMNFVGAVIWGLVAGLRDASMRTMGFMYATCGASLMVLIYSEMPR